MKLSWPGIRRRALIIGATGAQAYVLNRGNVTLEAIFTLEELELFQSYCQSRRRSQFIVLADLVEEDFQFDTIPYVIGPTRRQLLARKFDQLYRNMPYRACMSIGREANPAANSRRRDEQVLFIALTNQQALDPWLEVMHAAQNQVRGIYSPAVASAWLSQHATLTGRGVLAVTLNRAGLRQVYLENGQARFSRLTAIKADDLIAAGARIAAEITRTQQYLATMRWLQRTPGPLAVLMLCPPGVRAAWRTTCIDTDRLEFEFADLAAQMGSLSGLQASSTDIHFADPLWAAGALQSIPRVNLAPSWVNEHFKFWCWRSGIVATGAVACAAGLAAGGFLYSQASSIDTGTDAHMASVARANAQYQNIAKSFPKTLITPELLKNAVLALDPLAARPVSPEPILIQISQALLQAPAFAIDKIDWLTSTNPDAATGGTPPRPAPAAAPRPPAVPSAAGVPSTDRYEVVILTGALSQERAATPRRKVAGARAAIDALRSIPGVEVTALRLPMDVSPTGALKGGDDDNASEAAEPIVLRVTRKLPA